MAKVLILEDTIEVVETLKGMLEDEGHVVEAEMNPDHVMEKIKQFGPDLVTLDISFSEERDQTGIELLQEIRETYSKARLPILVISGTANADKLTRLMSMDISGYLGKPVKHADLKRKINDAVESISHTPIRMESWETRMVGESPAILELIPEIGKAAKAESDLLVTGEPGVGKEQVVQKYRELSPRRMKPFVVIDCTNINQSTFESEIFGH
jgi:DNA-binding NtrC family response regulator